MQVNVPRRSAFNILCPAWCSTCPKKIGETVSKKDLLIFTVKLYHIAAARVKIYRTDILLNFRNNSRYGVVTNTICCVRRRFLFSFSAIAIEQNGKM